MMRNWMKWPFIAAIFVFGVALGTVDVGQSWAPGGQKKIAYRTTPKWEIPFHRDAFKGDVPHFDALNMLCSSPEKSASWICKEFERQKRENDSLESEILSLKKQIKEMQSVVSVLDAERKQRLEKERRREERRKARREARLERKRKRKEQEAERERQQRKRADERYRWQKNCENGPKKFGMPLNFDCRIP